LKARIVELIEAVIAMQEHVKHFYATTDLHTTIYKLLEAMISVRSLLRLYIEEEQQQQRSFEGSQNRQAVKYDNEPHGSRNQEALFW
jgi:hypothetical protein